MSNPEFPSTKRPEAARETIRTREEVLALILPHIKDVASVEDLEGKVVRALSDDKGLYFLELQTEGENPGDMNEYQYMRAGNGVNMATETRIDVVYYVDGMPCGSDQLARFDEEK